MFRGRPVRQRQQARPPGRSSPAMPSWRRATREPIPAACRICCTVKAATRWPSLTHSPCTVRAKNSSASRDQVIFADRAVGASLSSDAVPLKIDRFGPRAARGRWNRRPFGIIAGGGRVAAE